MSEQASSDEMRRIALILAEQHIIGVADNGPVTRQSGPRAALTCLHPLTVAEIEHALTWAKDSVTAGLPNPAGLAESVPVIHPTGEVLHLSAIGIHGPAVEAALVTLASEAAVLLQHMTHRLQQIGALERYAQLAEQLDALTDTEAEV